MIKKILVTTDLSEQSKVAFALAKELATSLKAEILLLALKENPVQTAMIYSMDFPVFPDPELEAKLQEKLSSQLDTIRQQSFSGVTVSQHLLDAHGPISSEIVAFSKAKNIDLIVMATHGRTGLSRLLIGSVAERVVREAKCPVVTVPASENT